jgi:hypothetical protein
MKVGEGRLNRLTGGQIRDEDRRLQSADAKACDCHLATFIDIMAPGQTKQSCPVSLIDQARSVYGLQ